MMQAEQHSLLPYDALPQEGEQHIMAQLRQARVQATPGAVDLTPIRQRIRRTDHLATGRLPLLSRLLRRLHPGAFLPWSASTELIYAQRRRTGVATPLTDAGSGAPFADAAVAPARVVIPPATASPPLPVTVARKPGRMLGQPVVGDSPAPVNSRSVAAPLPPPHAPQPVADTPGSGDIVPTAATAPPWLARDLAAPAGAQIVTSPMPQRPAAETNPAPPDPVPASPAASRPAGQVGKIHPPSTPVHTGNLGAAIVQRHLRHVDSHAVGRRQAAMTVASLTLAPQPATVPVADVRPVTALPVRSPVAGTSDSPTARLHAQALSTAAPVKPMADTITTGTTTTGPIPTGTMTTGTVTTSAITATPTGEQPRVDRGSAPPAVSAAQALSAAAVAVPRTAARLVDHGGKHNEAQPAAVEQPGIQAHLAPSTALLSPSAGRADTLWEAAPVAEGQPAAVMTPRSMTGEQTANLPVAPPLGQGFIATGRAAGQTAPPRQTGTVETPLAPATSGGESPLPLYRPPRDPLPAVPPLVEAKRRPAPTGQPGLPLLGGSGPTGQVLAQHLQQASTHQPKPEQGASAPQAGSPAVLAASGSWGLPVSPAPATGSATTPSTVPPPVAGAGMAPVLRMARRTEIFGAPIVQRHLRERATLHSATAGPPRTDSAHVPVASVIAQPGASTLAPLPLLTPPAATPSTVSVRRTHAVAGDASAGTSPSVGVEQQAPAQTAARVTPTMTAATTSTKSASTVNEPVVQPKAANPVGALVWQREQQSLVAAELETPQPVQRDRPAPFTGVRSLAAAGTADLRATMQRATAHAGERGVAPRQRHSQAPTLSVPVHPVQSSTAAPALAPVWRTVPGVQTPSRQAVADVSGDQPDHPAGAKSTSAPVHLQRQEAATEGISRSVVVEQLVPVQAADQISSFAEGATIQARGRTDDAPPAAPVLSFRADLGVGHTARPLAWAHPATVTAPVGGPHLARRIGRATAMTATATQPRTSVADLISPHAMHRSRRSTALPSSVAMPVLFTHQPAAQTTSSLAAQEAQDAAVGQPHSEVDLPLTPPTPTPTLRRRPLADGASNDLSAKLLRRYLAYPAAQGLSAQNVSESTGSAYEPLPVARSADGHPPTTSAALGQPPAPGGQWPGATGASSMTAGNAVHEGSLSQGQEPATVLPLLLQRVAQDATAGASPPSSSPVTASPSSPAMSTTEIVRAGQEEQALERLAERVYTLIEQRLIIERESMGM